ncbi:RdgB/HAM1 family non-canonical purine NTP pyrophosphatase [Litoribrevibacter albus]|uniref:dITP/XTP pyrophosphatase n=1 Tax=Litoribrevibacter albus TaxID=1473156 RepID=A0AA37W6T1_9GAMM|nr:RdgB/HAM1 family non-canonical purine NTP pyrophosphatase [Litoribrevibacter albus]GLQ30553.1 non-canonical purine NTP pyrophosphatase [Litoribrevibacter albus]
MTQKIVLASNNQRKIKELSRILAELDIEVLPMSHFDIESPEETGTTFVENAILKARYVAEKTGLPALADDSGLSVDALNGAPGVYSARYAGENATDEDNNQKLLDAMVQHPEERAAHFHCVLAFFRHAEDPTPIICDGVWHGEILQEPLGDNGFGYDPLFWAPETQTSSAQLTPEQKNTLSHRAKALAEFKLKLGAYHHS